MTLNVLQNGLIFLIPKTTPDINYYFQISFLYCKQHFWYKKFILDSVNQRNFPKENEIQINLSGVETSILRENCVNTMSNHALDPCIGRGQFY